MEIKKDELTEPDEIALCDRCESTGIKYTIDRYIDRDGEPQHFFDISIRSGRDTVGLIVADQNVSRLNQTNFSDQRFLSKYFALVSYSDDLIEARIDDPSQFGIAKLLKGLPNNESEIKISNPGNDEQVIEISLPSDNFSIILSMAGIEPFIDRAKLTIKLTGFKVSTHDQALEVLESISNSIFFQIDSKYNIPLSLTFRTPPKKTIRKRQKPYEVKIDFPKFSYDSDAVSLYWFAHKAQGFPIFQYLAFYQILEHFFDDFSNRSSLGHIQNILRNPNFDNGDPSSISQLFNILKYTGAQNEPGSEKRQLRSLLMEIISPIEIRAYLTSHPEIKEFFDKDKEVSKKNIPMRAIEPPDTKVKDSDLFDPIAERIYDIRCRIVHAKREPETNQRDNIYPFSSESSLLSFDINLVKKLANKTLIASCKKLRL